MIQVYGFYGLACCDAGAQAQMHSTHAQMCGMYALMTDVCDSMPEVCDRCVCQMCVTDVWHLCPHAHTHLTRKACIPTSQNAGNRHSNSVCAWILTRRIHAQAALFLDDDEEGAAKDEL